VNAVEMIRLALSRLGTSRLRTFLTMLGVIIGVASVVALVAVGQGATSGITSRIAGLGTNLLTVAPGSTTSAFVRGARGSASTLKLTDAAAIATLDGVAGVAPEISTQAVVVAGEANTTTTILGTTADYATVRNYEVAQGSFLTGASVDFALRQAVLGATTASDLSLGPEAIGTSIRIGGLPFEVVGILSTKGSSGAFSQDDQVIVPVTTLQEHFVGGDSVRSISVSVASRDQIDLTKASITATLQQLHGTDGTNDDF